MKNLKSNIGNLLRNKKVNNIICGILFAINLYVIWKICKLLGNSAILLVLDGILSLVITVLKVHEKRS